MSLRMRHSREAPSENSNSEVGDMIWEISYFPVPLIRGSKFKQISTTHFQLVCNSFSIIIHS
jgi:hypothetical protein